MKIFYRNLRLMLCASTAMTLATGLAHAQSGAQTMNLGSVLATGDETSGGPAAPSATGSLKQALQMKKLAPNVISVQPQSQIAKNPDVNIADAFSRVPGVSLTSDSGEGQFINIRGLNSDLNGTTFDGIHLTANDQGSPSGNERAPDLAVFPSGLVGGVEVVKSLTPDMDAEGLGGSANILPIALPANGGLLANVTVAAGAETLRPTGIFQGNIQLGDSFAIPGMRSFTNAKPFSAIFAYSNYSDRRGIDDVEESYDPTNTITGGGNNADLDNLQFRYYQEHRVRQGYYGELDFNPSPQTGFFIRALKSGYTVTINKDRLELSNLDAPNATGPNGAIGSDGDFTGITAKTQARYTYSKDTVDTDVIEAGGHTVIADVANVDGTVSYTQGSSVEPFDYVTEFKGPKTVVNYNVNNTEYRSYTVPSGVDLANPNLYTLPAGNLTDNPQHAFDQEWAAALNASFANSILSGVGEAKFGAQLRLRAEGDSQSNYENAAAGPGLAAVSGSNQQFDYYNAHYELPPFPDYGTLLGETPLEGTSSDMIQADLDAYQHNSENVYAAYGQETIDFGKFEILGGLRIEDTNGTYRAYKQDSTGTITGGLTTNKQDYINLFPSAQFKYKFNDQFQLRAAYSTAIARPGFQQVSAASSVNQGGANNGDNLVTIGNPDLKPTTGDSFDLTAEYYGQEDTNFSANAFYKLFKNYIFNTAYYGTYQGQPAQFSTFQNENGAYARGIELDAYQRFYFLPGPLDGLGIDGNITFVDSHGHSDGAQYKAYQLPETSPLTYNATLSYVQGPLDAEISVNYVSRSLFQVVSPGAGSVDTNPRDWDTFTSARTTVDANLFFAVTPRVTLFAQARNLTNSPLEFTQSASSQYPIQREFYDMDYLVGVRLKLGA